MCDPTSGSYEPIVVTPVAPVEPEIVYIEVEKIIQAPAPEPITNTVTVVEEREKDNTVLIVIIAGVMLVLFVAMNAILCRRCIGKYKNRI